AVRVVVGRRIRQHPAGDPLPRERCAVHEQEVRYHREPCCLALRLYDRAAPLELAGLCRRLALSPRLRGAIWIDKESSRVLRIEMDARKIPNEFPLDHIE